MRVALRNNGIFVHITNFFFSVQNEKSIGYKVTFSISPLRNLSPRKGQSMTIPHWINIYVFILFIKTNSVECVVGVRLQAITQVKQLRAASVLGNFSKDVGTPDSVK